MIYDMIYMLTAIG